MNHEPPSHLADKYRLYAVWFENDFGSRPNQDMLIIHVARPMSFETLCDTYLFPNPELTIEKTGEKIKTNRICGVQKITNDNKPHYELAHGGSLLEIK